MFRSEKLKVASPLVDGFERQIRYLRISLTDRCNFRCTYCMPAEGVKLAPRAEVLRIEEIERLARVFANLGICRVRFTGGEPTLRRGLVDLVARVSAIAGIEEVVMTTNGVLLGKLAAPLREAGLSSVNISIDTLRSDRFLSLTRRDELARVVCGIEAAATAGLKIKLNVVALRDKNRDELVDLCRFAWKHGALPRFIEHMPLSEGSLYCNQNLLSASEIRDFIASELGPVTAIPSRSLDKGPARYWQVQGSGLSFGIISAMTENFCDTCNRVRLTATGQLHTCLAFDDATDLKALMRSGASEQSLEKALRQALGLKRLGHEFAMDGGGGPAKHMVSIGG